MINALANVNEISHVLGYKKYLPKKKNSFKMVAVDKFDSGKSLQGWLERWIERSETAGADVDGDEIAIKAEQGERGAAAIHEWLLHGIAGNRQLAEWEKRVPDDFFNQRPINIVKVAWTPCGQSFTDFIKKCTKCKGCPALFKDTLHANNPSDALLMVTNNAKKKTIIGVSLKATFKNADLTIYNGGVCGFLYLIVDKQDLKNKQLFCPHRGNPVGVYAARVPQVIDPYTDFNNELRSEAGYPAGTSADKQKWWKDNVQPAKNTILRPDLIKEKLNSFGGVRDNLFNEIENMWGNVGNVQENTGSELIISMPPLQLKFILAGILQFTHADVEKGGCKVPYVKLTAFGNMRIDIKPPAIEKYLEGAELWEGRGAPLVALGDGSGGGGDPDDDSEFVSIKIVKRAADSLMLCIYKLEKFIPYFLIRVKCGARPPGSLKIDIKPIRTRVCVQTGGARRVLPDDFERQIQKVENDAPELDVMLQNLLEDTFPDCEPEIKTRRRRNCTGEVQEETIDTDNVVLDEIAACREEAPTPLTDVAVEHALEEALKNKLRIINSHIPKHNYPTRQWLDRDFWEKQRELLFKLDKFLFVPPVLSDCCRRNPWAAAWQPDGRRARRVCNCVISGGSRKRRTKHRKRKYKKRKCKTRRKKY